MLRSRDYTFGMLELRLDAAGKCEGNLIAAAQLSFDKNGALEVKSYGIRPFRIANVKTAVVEPQ